MLRELDDGLASALADLPLQKLLIQPLPQFAFHSVHCKATLTSCKLLLDKSGQLAKIVDIVYIHGRIKLSEVGMTPNQVLKQFRRQRELTHEQMAEILGLTRARFSQYENGDSIPAERIREWSNSSKLPEWARHMAYQMWLAWLEQQHAAIGEQIAALSQVVMEQ